jgi:hypothetical protein
MLSWARCNKLASICPIDSRGREKTSLISFCKEMMGAGVLKAQAQKALQKSYKYFDSIGAFWRQAK